MSTVNAVPTRADAPKPSTKAKTKKPTKRVAKPASAPKGNRWTDAKKDAVRKRLKKGETYVAIASTFKVTPQTLWAVLNRKPKARALRRS